MANSSTGTNQFPSNPELSDLLKLFKKQLMLDFSCAHLATIQEFDGEKKTCRATINYKRTYQKRQSDGTYSPTLIDFPILADVPIVVMRGGNASLQMPIAVGDQALILFNDRDIDNWFAGKSNGDVATNRLHSISDGIALVGLINLSQTDVYDPDRAVLKNGDASVGVSASKIQIKNASKNLETILNSLITNIKNLVTAAAAIQVTGVQGGGSTSGVPANAATITAIGTALTTNANDLAALLE